MRRVGKRGEDEEVESRSLKKVEAWEGGARIGGGEFDEVDGKSLER
jgi:hypothetical protein